MQTIFRGTEAMGERITDLLTNELVRLRVESAWSTLSADFEAMQALMPERLMQRRELSFHHFVRLLGFLCIDLESVTGDILEIGVWKGKSLALMRRLTSPATQVIGIDPVLIDGQKAELEYFRSTLFPDARIIEDYSERALEKVLGMTSHLKLLHIDGGHESRNVWLDTILA